MTSFAQGHRDELDRAKVTKDSEQEGETDQLCVSWSSWAVESGAASSSATKANYDELFARMQACATTLAWAWAACEAI